MAFDFEDDDFDLAVVSQTHGTVGTGDYEDEVGIAQFYTEAEFRARGVDPLRPTPAKPGSEAKVLMLAARYAAGLPLWHESDCYDHGPHADRQN